jgi:hypothetical protein
MLVYVRQSNRIPPRSKHLLREWSRLPFTARIERLSFHRARSASKKGTWPLPPLALIIRRACVIVVFFAVDGAEAFLLE